MILAVIIYTAALFALGLYIGHTNGARATNRKFEKALTRPLGAAITGAEWDGVYYCQECDGARAWWHCCRHEVTLCYKCLRAHDVEGECYYIPACRAVFPSRAKIVADRLGKGSRSQ